MAHDIYIYIYNGIRVMIAFCYFGITKPIIINCTLFSRRSEWSVPAGIWPLRPRPRPLRLPACIRCLPCRPGAPQPCLSDWTGPILRRRPSLWPSVSGTLWSRASWWRFLLPPPPPSFSTNSVLRRSACSGVSAQPTTAVAVASAGQRAPRRNRRLRDVRPRPSLRRCQCPRLRFSIRVTTGRRCRCWL